MKINIKISQWIMGFNIKCKSIKLLCKKIPIFIVGPRVPDFTPKAQFIKLKIDKCRLQQN
jgi:hypothetical protein